MQLFRRGNKKTPSMADKDKIKKGIESIEKQIEKHRDKIKDYEGKNYALLEYWEKEIENMEKEKTRKKKLLEQLINVLNLYYL